MVEAYNQEEKRQRKHDGHPRKRNVARALLNDSGKHNEQSLPYDGCNAVESAAYSHVKRLLMLGECEHIESVGGNVVGSAHERHDPEHSQCSLKEARQRQGECKSTQPDANKKLHRHRPPPLGTYKVDKRAPKRFYDPRQIEP